MRLLKKQKTPQWWFVAQVPGGTKAKKVACEFAELGVEVKKMAYHVDVRFFEIEVWRAN